MARHSGRVFIAVLALGAASTAACGDSAESAEGGSDAASNDKTDGGSPGPGGDGNTVDLDDGGPGSDPSSCPHPEEPITHAFTKIYDPSVGENETWYINDHTFVRDDSGTWHLFGITHPEPADPFDEKSFAHATAPSLKGPWTKKPAALFANGSYGETLLWAPFVLHEGSTYYMFYCGGGSNRTEFQIELATSTDLTNWTREPAPLFKDGYDARDPMVLRVGNQWVLYYTANSQASGGNHVVAYRTSTDLKNWSEKKIAFTDPTTGTYAGPTESPFVVARGNDYYLFIGPREGYSNTAVFHSKDPFSFDPNNVVHRFESHAAEVVQDTDGTFYASHAGWQQGGVHLTPIDWLPTHCERLDGANVHAVVETAPRAGLLELTAGGRSVLSSNFRRTGPYLGVESFNDTPAGAAKSVEVSADTKRVTLKGIAFPGRTVTADWALCAGDDGLDLGLAWHVPSDVNGVHEVSLGLSSRLDTTRDATHVAAEGDYPGFSDWTLLSDNATSLIAAYVDNSAWQEDNRWLSSNRGTVAFQPLWSTSGKTLAAGDHAGGQFRLVVSNQSDDAARAANVATALAGNAPTCVP